MDFLITVIRLPVGLVMIPIVAAFWLVIWPVEFVLGIVCLPIAAIFMSRADIKASWLGEWPYISLRHIPDDSGKIWEWIFTT